MFGHELFKPYPLSIQFLAIVLEIVDRLPAGNGHLQDQLKRAACSITLNLAEGAGKTTSRDRLKFYSIARGSAMECAAICDVIALVAPQLSRRCEEGKAILMEIMRILSAVCGKKKAGQMKDGYEAEAESKSEGKRLEAKD